MAYRETAQVKARKAAQREALLRTAETLVRDGGFAAMTMQTVADRAGVGVGTLVVRVGALVATEERLHFRHICAVPTNNRGRRREHADAILVSW